MSRICYSYFYSAIAELCLREWESTLIKTETPYVYDPLGLVPRTEPDEWIDDTTQMLVQTRENGSKLYGTFWAERPCRFRRHLWQIIGRTEKHIVSRCQRCGSQDAYGGIPFLEGGHLPRRGKC